LHVLLTSQVFGLQAKVKVFSLVKKWCGESKGKQAKASNYCLPLLACLCLKPKKSVNSLKHM